MSYSILPMSSVSFSSSVSIPLWPLIPSAVRYCRKSSDFVVSAKVREIFMPALSSTMTEGKIVSWIKSEGDVVSKGENVVVVESDKADMDVESFYDGILAAIVVPEGQVARVGSPIGLLAETEADVEKAKAQAQSSKGTTSLPPPPPTSPEAVSAPIMDGSRKIIATPHARKLAKQNKINITSVVGTGLFGRVTPEDIEAAAGISPSKNGSDPVSPSPSAMASSDPFVQIPVSNVVPFTSMQGVVSKNMVASLSVPTFRVGYKINTDALDALYLKLKSKGVTMSALLAKAVAVALKQHSVVNASCKDGNSFTYNSNINIAVAVAIDGGLITPVLHDADKLDLYLLSQKWKELVGKARAKQLQPSEYNSGTFTLSNLGMFGVDRFDAILPPGQGAILAVGASKPTVVADADGFFSVKSQMLVNVTADHRIIYGADLAAFLRTFSKIIEKPNSLTL